MRRECSQRSFLTARVIHHLTIPHLRTVYARVSPAAETPYFGKGIQAQMFSDRVAQIRIDDEWYPQNTATERLGLPGEIVMKDE